MKLFTTALLSAALVGTSALAQSATDDSGKGQIPTSSQGSQGQHHHHHKKSSQTHMEGSGSDQGSGH